MKKITILFFAIVALGAGCKKFTDVNSFNPNSPLSATAQSQLSGAMVSAAANQGIDFQQLNAWMGYWARVAGYTPDEPTENYDLNTSTWQDGDFNSLYRNLSEWNNVELAGRTNASSLSFYIGAAKVFKALEFGELVDGYGNIPYSQAFNLNKYPLPKYDDAQTIYNALIVQLDSANYYFDKATDFYTGAGAGGSQITIDDQYDVMFGRSQGVDPSLRMAEWKQFSNTVKLRLLLHESNLAADQGTIKSEIAKAVADGGFLPAGTMASINPGYSSSQQAQLNPFWGTFYTNTGSKEQNAAFYSANLYALYYYYYTNDYNGGGNLSARLGAAYDVSSVIAGNIDGDPNSLPIGSTSFFASGILRGPTVDQIIISDFESLFLQAEAANLGYLTSGKTAAQLYKSAVEQDYIYMGGSAADADAYIGQTDQGQLGYDIGTVNYSLDVNPDPHTGTKGLQAILTQKWIALNSVDWLESWSSYRKMGGLYFGGYPTNDILGPTAYNNPKLHNSKPTIPYRLPYGVSESNTNGTNVPQGVTEYTPVFWDIYEK